MKNKELWRPSKFIYRKGKLMASRDPKEVGISSRLIVDLVAKFYNSCIKEHVKGNLIDLGCGKVPLYEAYKEHITDNTCVDWGNSIHKNPFLDYEQDLNEKLRFEDETFDTIILSDVLEHIRKPEVLLNEMFRILSKNGKLIMNVPFYYWLHEQPFDYYRYTEHALKSMAEDCGFNVIKLEPIGGAPEILGDITSKMIIGFPVFGKYSAIGIQKITSIFIQTKFGEKLSKSSARNFPLGYTMIAQKE